MSDEQNSAAQLAEAAKSTGRYEALNEVLAWALENASELRSAGLMESLVALCSRAAQ